MNRTHTVRALLALFIACLMLFATGCQTNDGTSFLENEQSREIARSGASVLLDIGFAAIIANNPDLATEMRLARNGISYLASNTARSQEGAAIVDAGTLTADIEAAILEQVSDPVIAEVLMSDFADGIAAVEPPDDVPASGSAYSQADREALLHALRRS